LIVSMLETATTIDRVVIMLPTDLTSKYALLFNAFERGGADLYVRAFVIRIYNERGEVVREYAKVELLPVIHISTSFDRLFFIDFTNFHIRDGIPVGYFAELLLINFRVRLKDGEVEIPIFSNELYAKIDPVAPEGIMSSVEKEVETLRRLGRDIETVGMLYEVGLGTIAEDLMEGLVRFYGHDPEGAITFFRKVVEGVRNYIRNNKILGMGEHRQKFLHEFLSKAYQLISNFGQHAGTRGSMPEADFSKDIAVALCRYVASYLKR